LALSGEALLFAVDGLFLEMAIKLRYHPASSVTCWASNGCKG
jgi:hypothetical protein